MTHHDVNDPLVLALAAAHANIVIGHGQTRAQLRSTIESTSLPPSITGQTSSRRMYLVVVTGGIAAALTLFVGAWLSMPESATVAMERLARALEQVNSYSYRMESIYISQKDQGRTVRQVTEGNWRTEPVGLRAKIVITERTGVDTGPDSPWHTLVDIEEAHATGERGILIDHLKKEFWWIDDPLTAASIPPGSPQVAVYMVQQRRGRVLRDLGERRQNGRVVRGLEFVLDAGQPVSELGVTSPESEQTVDWRNAKITVWIDPTTDLPVEFQHTRLGDDFSTTYRFTDLKWNVEFSRNTFQIQEPVGYEEINKSSEVDGR
ncbi:MAG: hypothetical protein KDA60_20590 [Planctomycetales bacterium]|nr:hypothetical protein [Planctomycetales bacterium]